MRLLNSRTLEPEDFSDEASTVPKYAVLSHRWQREEVSLKELLAGSGSQKVGWKKIQSCCKQAVEDGLEYIWIDTCCVDKTSSAELSESINSMYRWYQESEVCYAYLYDVESLESGFSESVWWSRSWYICYYTTLVQLKN